LSSFFYLNNYSRSVLANNRRLCSAARTFI
jgi:hypothetical protein